MYTVCAAIISCWYTPSRMPPRRFRTPARSGRSNAHAGSLDIICAKPCAYFTRLISRQMPPRDTGKIPPAKRPRMPHASPARCLIDRYRDALAEAAPRQSSDEHRVSDAYDAILDTASLHAHTSRRSSMPRSMAAHHTRLLLPPGM